MSNTPVNLRLAALRTSAPPSSKEDEKTYQEVQDQAQRLDEGHDSDGTNPIENTPARSDTAVVSDTPAEWGGDSEYFRSEATQPIDQANDDKELRFNDSAVEGMVIGNKADSPHEWGIMHDLNQMLPGGTDHVLNSVGMMFGAGDDIRDIPTVIHDLESYFPQATA